MEQHVRLDPEASRILRPAEHLPGRGVGPPGPLETVTVRRPLRTSGTGSARTRASGLRAGTDH